MADADRMFREPAVIAAATAGGCAVPRILISGAHRSSGKTTIALGLAAALRARGLVVQPFKKGPDYIDPMWLGHAAGRGCYNLDPYLMTGDAIGAMFAAKAEDADIALVEGNQGLFDGVALDGSNSSAALAAMLGMPVVLVIDARGMNRGVAPILLGYQAFDRTVRIGGVLLNRVGSARHEAKLRAVIEHYTDIPVLGAVRDEPAVGMTERHLGLVPTNEAASAREQIDRIGAHVAEQVDLDRVLAVARSADLRGGGRPMRADMPEAVPIGGTGSPRARIGVAMDRAVGFYYADDLEALRRAGAEIVPFDTLRDRDLPEIDALFIGGGFPESCAAELAANASLRGQIAAAVARGMPAYAECGGLMYLARSLIVDGRRHEMVGAIPGDVHMQRRPVGSGYVELEGTGHAPHGPGRVGGAVFRAHEFHYSAIAGLPPGTRYAYRVRRGYGVDGENDGIVVRNLVASYSHLRSIAGADWARQFVDFVAHASAARADHAAEPVDAA